MTEQHAKVGLYIGLGISTAVIIACRAIEWVNYQMKVTPKAKLKQ